MSITDTIDLASLLTQKYKEKHTIAYAAFLDLETTFDRVPHKVIWWTQRSSMHIKWKKLTPIKAWQRDAKTQF